MNEIYLQKMYSVSLTTLRTVISCIITRSMMILVALLAIYTKMLSIMRTMKSHRSLTKISETLISSWRMVAAENVWRPSRKLANLACVRSQDYRGELLCLAMGVSIVDAKAATLSISAEIRGKKSKTGWKKSLPMLLAPLKQAANTLRRDSDYWIVMMKNCWCRMNTMIGIAQESISMSTYYRLSPQYTPGSWE